jgi:hypothetical protein
LEDLESDLERAKLLGRIIWVALEHGESLESNKRTERNEISNGTT